MPIGTALALGGAALFGGIAGAMGDHKSESSGVNLRAPSELQNTAQANLNQDYGSYRSMLQSGPGQQDVEAGYGSQRDLASMLQQYQQNGAYATQGDIDKSNGYANQLFAPQQAQLNQSFENNRQQFAQQAAIQGRNPLDAVFANKQYTSQANSQQILDAQKGQFATGYAMQQPMQRLGFAEQRTNVLSGLATQAMQNRQALMAAGSGVLQNERNYQYTTSDKWGNQDGGGGIAGAINGGLAGLGAGSKLVAGFNSAPSSNPFTGGTSGGGYGSNAFNKMGGG